MKTLIELDRLNGVTREIPELDPYFTVAIGCSCVGCHIPFRAGLAILKDGGELTTPLFIRYLKKFPEVENAPLRPQPSE